MRKLLVTLFAVLIIGMGILGMKYDAEENEMTEDPDHTVNIAS